MIAVVRVRFDTNKDSGTVMSDELFRNWMTPLIPNSLGDFWSTSSRGLFSLDYTLYPSIVIKDPRPNVASDNASQRGALVAAAIDGATKQVAPDWDSTDILLLWFAQTTDMFGGGSGRVPLSNGGTKDVRVTVVDLRSAFDAACQELGHSFGLNHEVDANGAEYASPYSVMSMRLEDSEFLRSTDARLPDGGRLLDRRDWYVDQPGQWVIGPVLAAAQLYAQPSFRNSRSVIELPDTYRDKPALVTLYALDYQVRQPPGPLPVLATFPSNIRDGRRFTVELRRGGSGYDAAIGTPSGPPAGLVVHSINPDGRIRYEGVAPLTLAAEMTDWPCAAGDFALRILRVGPAKEFVEFAVRARARKSFPIRGVLLAGKFRTQHQLNTMSHDDMRNTLIVELTKHSNQNDYQAFDNDTLAGMGAVLVYLRETRMRSDSSLKSMSADDQRNTLIVALDTQTGQGAALQAFSNMELVLIALGSDLATRGQVPGVLSSFIRGALLAGHFRTQQELNGMTRDQQRNTLIVEMTKHSNQTNYQSYNDFELEGVGAVMVLLPETKLRDDASLAKMSADDQRNVLIVELGVQTNLGARLQAFTNQELVLTALGVERV